MTLISCDSVYCVCCEAWSSRWLMTQLTNGQHACVQMVDILSIPCVTVNLFSLYLMNFMFHNTLDAVVSLSRGSVSTLFRWGKHVFHACVKCSSCLQQCKNIKKNQTSFSRVLITNILPRFFMNHSIQFCIVVYSNNNLFAFVIIRLTLSVKDV